jgi:hypothetical protein
VTPKQGTDVGGLDAVRKLHLVLLCAALLVGGTVMRLLDLAGIGPLHDLPGIAMVIVPLLGVIELRRILRTMLAVGRHQQRRLVYRFEGDAPAQCIWRGGHVAGRLIDASASGVGLLMDAPLPVGSRPTAMLELADSSGETHEVAPQVEVRTCREFEGRWLVGATITSIEPAARMRLMEWCYVVCSHERLRGSRPGPAPAGAEPIVVPLEAAPARAAA